MEGGPDRLPRHRINRCPLNGQIIFLATHLLFYESNFILTSSFFNFLAADSPLPMGELGRRPFAAAEPTASRPAPTTEAMALTSDLGLLSLLGEMELVL